jgi:hypothetical protein
MRLHRMRAPLFVLAGAAVTATVGALVAGASENPQPDPDARALRTPAQRVTEVAAGQKASFGVFRRARTSDDALPSSVVKTMSNAADQLHGENAALSRRARIPGKRIWLSVGEGTICRFQAVSVTDVDETCQPTSGALAGRLVGWQDGGSIPKGEAAVSGVVPDGVTSVAVSYADGRTQQVAVVDNVYAFTATGSPTIRFTDSQGGEHSVGPLPVLPG